MWDYHDMGAGWLVMALFLLLFVAVAVAAAAARCCAATIVEVPGGSGPPVPRQRAGNKSVV
jgi:hypothetical protein